MKSIYIIMGILISGVLYSQMGVGVNTNNPLGKFHIDAQKNTAISGGNAINTADDVMITEDANIGIGTVLPQSKLEVNSQNEAAKATLRFTQLSPDTPILPGPKARLGVNKDGDVVIVNTAKCVPSLLIANGSSDSQIKNVVLNADISPDFDHISIVGSTSNISISPEGYYILKPGNTYRLEGSIYLYGTFTGTGTMEQVRWYNITQAAYFGSQPRSTLATASGAYANGEQGRSMAVISPTEETIVTMRVTSNVGDNGQYKPFYSYASILQINPCGIVD